MGRTSYYDEDTDDVIDIVAEDEADEEEWNDLMCSMGHDGQCGQAGSEFCDFECRRWETFAKPQPKR